MIVKVLSVQAMEFAIKLLVSATAIRSGWKILFLFQMEGITTAVKSVKDICLFEIIQIDIFSYFCCLRY